MTPLFIFVDEAGNFDFSQHGSKYLILTAVSSFMPFWWYPSLPELKNEILSKTERKDIEYFHAADDEWPTRTDVFSLIRQNIPTMRIDSIVVEKRKSHPKTRDDARFYPDHLSRLIRYVVQGHRFTTQFPETIVLTDRIPHNRKRSAIEGAVKSTLKALLHGSAFRSLHHDSKAHAGLQIADYCCWAIQRKWERGDQQYFELIRSAIRSEFDVYKTGEFYYY